MIINALKRKSSGIKLTRGEDKEQTWVSPLFPAKREPRRKGAEGISSLLHVIISQPWACHAGH